MLICVCCPDPRITCGQENAIEIPDDCLEDFTMYDAEEGALNVSGKDLEKRGLVYLNDFWHTPNLERISGVYILS